VSPEEILTVLNGLEPVNTDDWVFCVITRGSREHYNSRTGQIEPRDEESWWPFEKGEVVVLDDEYGREPFGEERKPSKWDLEVEHFDSLADAVACREAVLAGTWKADG
jgi:hypothetical protein